MSIKNLHTTIDYKELIERVNPQDKFKSKNNYNNKVKKKVIKRK